MANFSHREKTAFLDTAHPKEKQKPTVSDDLEQQVTQSPTSDQAMFLDNTISYK